jgi:hypothetical protein
MISSLYYTSASVRRVMRSCMPRQNSVTVTVPFYGSIASSLGSCRYRHRHRHRHWYHHLHSAATTITTPDAEAAASIQSSVVPIIDMSLSEQEIGDCIHHACTTDGFFIVVKHGVSADLCSRILQQAKLLFTVLSPQDKEAISIKHSNSYRGYQGMGVNITNGLPDGHEALDLISESTKAMILPTTRHDSSLPPNLLTNFGKNQWPDPNLLPDFRSTTEEYINAMQTLGQRLMGACSRGLGLDPTYFEPYFDDAYWTMRMIRYPVQHDNNHNTSINKEYDFGVGKEMSQLLYCKKVDASTGAVRIQAS